jgi:NAD-dependent dihydropyrimidine dehydrogenase PreA subunit
MPAVIEKDKCNACKSCEEVCPSQAIAMVSEKAEVKPEDCIDCNACVDACASGAISMA